MSTLSEAADVVRRDYVADDYISRVKTLIADRIGELDPSVKIENTQYFNHSAIPDFVLSWSSDRLTRDIYLRGSYASIIAGADVANLVDHDPIFVALDKQQDFDDEIQPVRAEAIRTEAIRQEHTLLTDISAVGNLSDAAPDHSGPLTSLVQANFVRGARGLVDDDRAEQLVSTSSVDGRTTISDVLRETFSDETFTRMERTAAIVDLALASNEQQADQLIEQSAKLSGRLSDAEMVAVIPWLLRDSDGRRAPAFWRQLGALFSFEALEKLGPLLEGLDVSGLIRANSDRWNVRRSYVGTYDYNDPDRITRVWTFKNGVLTVDSEYHRLWLSSRAQMLRGRMGTSLPRWQEIRPPLNDFRLRSVDLRGVTRSVRVDAERSDDIRQDVEDIATSIADDYSVNSVTVRFISEQNRSGVSDALIEFARGVVSAPDEITIEEMTRTSLRVLVHRNAVDPQEVARIVTAAAQPAD